MKKNLLISSCIIILFIGFMSVSFNSNENKVVFTFMNEIPNLPETPYEYSDIEFPIHTFNDTIQTGYENDVDTTILDFVDDDISTLGRVLFYDEKLSAMENMSCATCHKQELSFADDVQFSQGISSLTQRNSMALNDLSWEGKIGFFWDMEFSNLEDMIDIPFKDENEVGAQFDEVVIKMNSTEYYPELFENAFGDSEVTEERIVSALTNFVSSMVTFNSRFDQEANIGFTGFTTDELAGLELFSFNCAVCHSNTFGGVNSNLSTEDAIMFFPFIFNNGLEATPDDLGAGDWFIGAEGLFKVTSLRNIELSAPYMHNGSLETLDDVIDFYSDDVQNNDWSGIFIPQGGFNFSDTEKNQLKAFLLTLTDESFKTNVKWSDPFSPISSVVDEDLMGLMVAPNPMNNYTNITLEGNELTTAQLLITDQLGRIVFKDEFKGNEYSFNNYSLPSGIYNVSINNEKSRNSLQLIIQ